VPITIVATVGSASANSFVTADEMTAYCDARLNASTWSAADAQLPALVDATRDLSLLDYAGSRVDTTQALAWPRYLAPNPDAPSVLSDPAAIITSDGEPYYFASDVVPQRVKDATCELALQYLKLGDTDASSNVDTRVVIRKKVDVLETEWAEPTPAVTPAVGLARWPRVMAYVAPLLEGGTQLGIVRT
jgi:hypothetical protein